MDPVDGRHDANKSRGSSLLMPRIQHCPITTVVFTIDSPHGPSCFSIQYRNWQRFMFSLILASNTALLLNETRVSAHEPQVTCQESVQH